MTKVFLDASVIIAAIISQTGGSAKILSLVKSGNIIGITSQSVIDEIEEHLDKIGKSKIELANYLNLSKILIRERVKIIEIQPFLKKIDEEDAHLIAGAKLTKADFLVSLDKKHLLNEEIKNKFFSLEIVSPKEFLEKLLER